MSVPKQDSLSTGPAFPNHPHHSAPSAARGDPAPRLAASYARSAVVNPAVIARQHARNAATAARDGFVIPDAPGFRWEDDGRSGTAPDRPGLHALLAVAETGRAPFTRLYLTDPTRFSRSLGPRGVAQLEIRLADCGVAVHYDGRDYRIERLVEDTANGTADEGHPASADSAQLAALLIARIEDLIEARRALPELRRCARPARRPCLDP